MAHSLLPVACLLLTTGAWVGNAQFNEKFTTSLMKELSSSGGNVVFSPASMETALGVVALGAKGKTMEQMFTTLGNHPQDARQAIQMKQSKLNEKPTAPGVMWQTANRIMAAPDLPVKKEYIEEVKTVFPGVAVDNFSFHKPAETAAEVNSWVSQNTNQVIKKLVDEQSINPNTRMIVLNAVYFKGEWKNGFDKKFTKKECFYSEPGKCTQTDMMHLKNDFKYGYDNDIKAQIIELPYKNEDYSMVVVLPDEKHGNLSKLIANLNVDKIISFIDEKKWPVEVHVTLPKFEIEFEQEMKQPLINLGMENVFSSNSDLSGMINGLRAKVDSVIHKAKITCDEEGTVAAAATALQVTAFSAKITSDFLADHPFVYLIKKKEAGILFMGTYAGPSK